MTTTKNNEPRHFNRSYIFGWRYNEEYISDRNLQILQKEINDLKAEIQSFERLQVLVKPIEIPVKSETETKKERIHDLLYVCHICFCSE